MLVSGATLQGGARPHMHSFSAFDTFLGLPDFEERVAREIEVRCDDALDC